MPSADYSRKIPSVDSLLRSEVVKKLLQMGARREFVVSAIRVYLDSIRTNSEIAFSQQTILEHVTELVRSELLKDSTSRTSRVINATGIILHTNLGRAPLAEAAIDRVVTAASACNLEYDLNAGQRGERGLLACRLLERLTGAEGAVVVNNCAAATWLALQTLSKGRECVVSRSQLVEIGGSYRLPDIAESAGIRLREVGTTNRTYLADYEQNIGDSTGALLRIHRSNFVLSGYVHEPKIEELARLGTKYEIPVIDDLGSGCLYDLSEYSVSEPMVAESLKAGADLVLFSGDKLFGGPQCGIILGKMNHIQALKANPICRALRVCKLTLAALEATLELHLAGNAFAEIPTLQMLSASYEQLHSRCKKIIAAIHSKVMKDCVSIVDLESHAGGGTLPGATFKSAGIRFQVASPQDFANRLRMRRLPIVGRIADRDFLMDLRSVSEDDDSEIIACLNET